MTLADFGGGATDDPPRVKKTEAIHISVGGNPRHVGYLAEVPTEGYPKWAFVAPKDSDEHRFRYLRENEGGAYAVSIHALVDIERAAQRRGTSRPATVFIHELDSGDVYEYEADDLFDGPTVPDNFLESMSDPQKYVTIDGAKRVWRDHAPDGFYITRGEETNTE